MLTRALSPGRLALWHYALLALAGTAVLALSSKVQVPFYPVPMTLQTAAVFLIGFAYGPVLGAATVLLWLGQALVGLPVLALAVAGPTVVFGPTGGYLLGFAAAAYVCGVATARGYGALGLFLATILGSLIVYVLGALWLAGFVGGLGEAFAAGVVPFVLGDLLKAALAAAAGSLGLARLGFAKG